MIASSRRAQSATLKTDGAVAGAIFPVLTTWAMPFARGRNILALFTSNLHPSVSVEQPMPGSVTSRLAPGAK